MPSALSSSLPADLRTERGGPILRRGAPLLWGDESGILGYLSVSHPDSVGWIWLHHVEPWVDGTPRDRSTGQQVRLSDVSLDLTDDLGRDIAARWLARSHGLTVGATAPEWLYDPPSPSPRDRDGAPYREDWPGRWLMRTPDDYWLIFVDVDPEQGPDDDRWYPDAWIIVPGISTTDPAEALAFACLAVAGRSR